MDLLGSGAPLRRLPESDGPFPVGCPQHSSRCFRRSGPLSFGPSLAAAGRGVSIRFRGAARLGRPLAKAGPKVGGAVAEGIGPFSGSRGAALVSTVAGNAGFPFAPADSHTRGSERRSRADSKRSPVRSDRLGRCVFGDPGLDFARLLPDLGETIAPDGAQHGT